MVKVLKRSSPVFAAIVALSALAGAGAPAQAAGHCVRASQCHGPLPQICERCSNGHSVCAHWACVEHRCVVQLCGRVTRYK
jgi:hypothetical protein